MKYGLVLCLVVLGLWLVLLNWFVKTTPTGWLAVILMIILTGGFCFLIIFSLYIFSRSR